MTSYRTAEHTSLQWPQKTVRRCPLSCAVLAFHSVVGPLLSSTCPNATVAQSRMEKAVKCTAVQGNCHSQAPCLAPRPRTILLTLSTPCCSTYFQSGKNKAHDACTDEPVSVVSGLLEHESRMLTQFCVIVVVVVVVGARASPSPPSSRGFCPFRMKKTRKRRLRK